MGLFWFLVIGSIIWAAVALLPRVRPGGQSRLDSPEELLDRRFALGEIDTEQYRQARGELAASRPRGQ
jgi:putative membrane protein